MNGFPLPFSLGQAVKVEQLYSYSIKIMKDNLLGC